MSFYGTEGAGVVPYYPQVVYNTSQGWVNALRFHQRWFSRKNSFQCTIDRENPPNPIPCDICCNNTQNIFHLMGIKETNPATWGITWSASDITCSAIATIEAQCAASVPPCTADELMNAIQQNFSHEWAHDVGVNCADDGHDDNDAWCTPCGGAINPQICLMNRNADIGPRLDNIDRFCCFNLLGNPGHCNDPEECGNSIRFCPDPE